MKFINLTYGLKGESKQYTYLVNDNVKVGQVVFPSFRHKPDGNICGTVGIVQTTNSVTSKSGIEMAKMMESKGITPNYMVTSGTLKVGNDVMKDENGRFVGGSGISKTQVNEENLYVSTTPDNYNPDNARVKSTQEMNKQLMANQQETRKETYDSYVSQYFDINGR